MGNCTNQRKLKAGSKNIYFTEPEDTPQFKNRALPLLELKVLLAKVKVVNPPQNNIRICFALANQEEIILPSKDPDEMNTLKWQISEKMELKLTEYQLRKTFMKVILLTQKNVLSVLQINMYQASVGPHRFDFEFPGIPNNLNKCRISFDLRISQMVKLSVQADCLEVFGLSDEIGDQYAFEMKTVFGEEFQTSEMSSVCTVDRKHASGKAQATWSSTTLKMPKLSTSQLQYKVNSGTLKFSIWQFGVDNPNDKQLVGESFISFIKILNTTAVTVNKQNLVMQVRSLSLSEKLLSNGKQYGQIRVSLTVEIEKHLKQMMFYVATEKGILKINPMVTIDGQPLAKSHNQHIQQMEAISQELVTEEQELEKKKQYMSHDPRLNIEQNLDKIASLLEKLLQILEKSEGQTMNMFTYSSIDQLLTGQQILIDIGLKLLNYLNNESQRIELLKCKVLSVIIFRGELSLVHIGFEGDTELCHHPKIFKKKVNIGLKNQQFLYEILRESFRILGRNGISEEKKLAQRFMVISYIRIPEFRKLFLETIAKESDPPIEQWRGSHFQINNQERKKISANDDIDSESFFSHFFDWEKKFYVFLKEKPEFQQNYRKLQTVLRNQSWKQRISNRRGAFFGFIIELVEFVKSILIKISPEDWDNFPGYIEILRALLSELKIRQVRQYPSSIKQVCSALLVNENLLNIFVTILFTKTNLHNNFDVVKVLIICNTLFSSLKEQSKKIPSSFDYIFFFNCIKKVIENFYSYSVAEALCLIYDNFDFFPTKVEIQISNYLLGNVFFKLFMHWSHNVRNIFHKIIIVKITKLTSESAIEQERNEVNRHNMKQISERINKLFTILQNVEVIQQQNTINADKQALHKKMSLKLRNKRNVPKTNSLQAYNMDLTQITLSMIPQFEWQSDENLKQKNLQIMENLSRRNNRNYNFQRLFKMIEQTDNNVEDQGKQIVIRRRINKKIKRSYSEQSNNLSLDTLPNPEFNTHDEIEIPVILQSQLSYLKTSLKEFEFLCQQLVEGTLELDSVRMEVAMDRGEIRPDTYRDVEEW